MKIDLALHEGYHIPAFQSEGCARCRKAQEPPYAPTLLEKVARVASFIFKVLISIFLFWINPSLVSLGFVLGVVADEQCSRGIQKIYNVWKSQPWGVCFVGIFAGILSLPVTLGVGSCLWGAYGGAMISHEAQKMIPQKHRETDP
jgi:hypothetical protein